MRNRKRSNTHDSVCYDVPLSPNSSTAITTKQGVTMPSKLRSYSWDPREDDEIEMKTHSPGLLGKIIQTVARDISAGRLVTFLLFVAYVAFRIYIRNFSVDPEFRDLMYRGSLRAKGGVDDNDGIISREFPSDDTSHRHRIEDNLIFTYTKDLIKAHDSSLSTEERALKANVHHTISLHPSSKVNFFTDDDCLASIRRIMKLVPHKLKDLDTYFIRENQGMYKADMCRGAALYELGGLYFDVDIVPRMTMWTVLDRDIEFVVPRVYEGSSHQGAFFQAFIGVRKGQPVLLKYLEGFVEYYSGKILHQRLFQPPLGVVLLRRAFDAMPPGVQEKSALWKEVRYEQFLFPDVEPTQGIMRCCHYVVAIPHTRVVPFYSRAKGSRLCHPDHSLWEVFRSLYDYFSHTFLRGP